MTVGQFLLRPPRHKDVADTWHTLYVFAFTCKHARTHPWSLFRTSHKLHTESGLQAYSTWRCSQGGRMSYFAPHSVFAEK